MLNIFSSAHIEPLYIYAPQLYNIPAIRALEQRPNALQHSSQLVSSLRQRSLDDSYSPRTPHTYSGRLTGGEDHVATPGVDALLARGRRRTTATDQCESKGKEEREARGPPAVQWQEREKGRREDDWTTVERRQHGGGAKRARKAEIVDRGGVTTFWSTPEGLYESWRPARGRYAGKGEKTIAWADKVFEPGYW